MTKHELAHELAKRLDLPRPQAAKMIDALFGRGGIVPGELVRGRKVLITGFGQFEPRARAARNGRDPRTGHAIAIEASTAPVFRPGKPLRDLLNRKRG